MFAMVLILVIYESSSLCIKKSDSERWRKVAKSPRGFDSPRLHHLSYFFSIKAKAISM